MACPYASLHVLGGGGGGASGGASGGGDDSGDWTQYFNLHCVMVVVVFFLEPWCIY